MHVMFGVIFMLHGIAHVAGFVVPWRIATFDEMPYKTTILAGAVDLGDVGIRVIGGVWLATAVAFGIAAVGAFVGASWWFPVAFIVTTASFLLTLLGWPDSRIGVAVNGALLVALGTTAYFAWRML